MAKDARIPIRVPAALKDDFERAADNDGLSVSGWLRWLGERRIEEQHANTNGSAKPAPAAFIPGYGLEEDS